MQWVVALGRVVLPLLLIVAMGFVYAKDNLYFDNGAGGADWRIGKPKVTWLSAHRQPSLTEARQFALALVNRDRQLNGLKPLVEDPLLAQAAQNHAADMLKRNYFAHKSPEGKTPSDRFAQVGGQGGAGENIFMQTGTIGISITNGLLEQFQKGWMYSPGHRQNLLEPSYTRFGYGIVADSVSGQAYAVQNFARPKP
ncbi:MAG TPA: CAP domain-containing protein [Thermosynechococcaceae cyanobacterium]